MKKIAMTFVTILILTVFAASAFASGPSWNNGNRHETWNRHQPVHYQFKNHQNHQRPIHYQKVVHVPVRPAPVVHARQYDHRPVLVISIPNFSFWLR